MTNFDELDKSDWINIDEFKHIYQKAPIVEINSDVSVDEPLVSILIITYQHKDYITSALDCAARQVTDFEFEILICDDGSTDGTQELCRSFVESYKGVARLFLNSRENNIAVMNRPCGIFQFVNGLLQCRGRYVAVISGDDLWTDSSKIQKQVNLLKLDASASACYTPWEDVRFEGGRCVSKELKSHFPKASTLLFSNIFKRVPVQMCSVLQEDYFILALLELHGNVRLLSNVSPVTYRLHGENIWASKEIGFKKTSQLLTDLFLYDALKDELYGEKYLRKALRIYLSNFWRMKGGVGGRDFARRVRTVRALRVVINELAFIARKLVFSRSS